MSSLRAPSMSEALRVALACVCLVSSDPIAADTHDARILQSARGDHVALDAPTPFDCAYAPCPARICIETPLTRPAMALSIGAGTALARRVEPGGAGCVDLAPVLHMVTFWAEDAQGQMLAVLTAPLDLRDGVGTVTWARWLQEAAQ